MMPRPRSERGPLLAIDHEAEPDVADMDEVVLVQAQVGVRCGRQQRQGVAAERPVRRHRPSGGRFEFVAACTHCRDRSGGVDRRCVP